MQYVNCNTCKASLHFVFVQITFHQKHRLENQTVSQNENSHFFKKIFEKVENFRFFVIFCQIVNFQNPL